MFTDIQRLMKDNGYIPDMILDIGACVGAWTSQVQQIYPFANYFLFEPIDYPQLKSVRGRVFNVVLNDVEKEVDWYQLCNTGDSMFKEKTRFFSDVAPMKKQSVQLASVMAPFVDRAKNVFIKIDCQGAEIPILKGAGETLLAKTDFVLMEMPMFGQYNDSVPGFLEHVQFMDSIGFEPFHMSDVHSSAGFTIQCDMFFIRKGHPFCELLTKRLMGVQS